ncbi:MAG: hypothetical protein ACRDHE_08525, partial [Ktedonobacterales bacterium]
MRLSARPTLAAVSASAVLLLSVFLAGCGQSSNVAGAAATPTCPARATAAKSVSGTVASVGSSSLTVTQADGTTSTVHLDSKTRITKFSIVTSSAITTGARVSVVADTAVTTAKDVLVNPAGATVGGGNGFGRGRGAGTGPGTPTTRVNRSCFPTRAPGTPVAGGRPGGGTGGIGNFTQGLLGNTSGYQGLNGTVDSITATKLTFDDPQGQT